LANANWTQPAQIGGRINGVANAGVTNRIAVMNCKRGIRTGGDEAGSHNIFIPESISRFLRHFRVIHPLEDEQLRRLQNPKFDLPIWIYGAHSGCRLPRGSKAGVQPVNKTSRRQWVTLQSTDRE
jgi:hypothetical protein